MTTQITASNLTPSFLASIDVPKITVLAYPGDDQAADPAGGQTITLTGTGFVTGCTVFTGSTQVGTVTFISETSVTFISLALASATYTVYVINPDGGTAALIPGISYSGLPNWTTSAGSIASVYEYSSISSTVTATGDAPVSYALYSGSLPSGSSLNTSTGLISGTSIASAGATTSSFVIRATDGQLQDSDRSFSITVNTDVVTWNSPTSGSTVTLPINSASSTALSATSAAGKSITYTANALPTGLSIVSSAVTGTPTVTANTTSLFTATAATDGKTTTATINWVVSVASDPYFNSVTLLLSASTPTSNFIADASVNTFAISPSGSGTPSANTNNPVQPGYYSGYFPGTTSYYIAATIPALTNFTVECWAYFSGSVASRTILTIGDGNTSSGFEMYTGSGGLLTVGNSTGSVQGSVPVANSWYHLAAIRVGSTLTFYVNGVSVGTPTSMGSTTLSTALKIGYELWNGSISQPWLGYISNLRIVSGVTVYTGAFTPPTSPLAATQSAGTNIAAITGTATSLLTLQSYSFIDNSTYQATLTPTGTPDISVTQPFTLPSPYTGYGAGYFDGSSNLVGPTGDATLNTALNILGEDFTIEFWYNPNTTNAGVCILTNFTASGGNGWEFGSRIGAFYLNTWTSNTSIEKLSAAVGINAGLWCHVALVKLSGNLYFYVNGTEIGMYSGYTRTATPNPGAGTGLGIGAYIQNPAYPSYTSGYLSNVRITKGTAVYTGAFTPPTLAPLTNAGATSAAAYPSTTNVNTTFASSATSLLTLQNNQAQNNNQFRDSSTNNFAVTRTGTPTQGTFTPFSQTGWSGYFNGSSYISVPKNTALEPATSGAWTIEFFFYTNSTASQRPWTYGNTTISAGSDLGTYCTIIGGGVAQGGFYSGSGGVTVQGGTVPLNQWNHLATVSNGTTMTLYLNGVSVGTPVTVTGTSINAPSSATGRIGIYASSDYFDGYISNFRFVKGVAVYTGAFTPPTTTLQATQSAGTNIAAITGTATSLLTLQNNRFKDNAVTPSTITASGTPSIQAFSPFAPTTTYSTSAVGGSGYFNGSTDWLTLLTNADIPYAYKSGNFCLECWHYMPSAYSSTNYLVSYWNSAPNKVIILGYSPVTAGKLSFLWTTDGTTDKMITSADVIPINQWHHIAVMRTGNTISMFVDGIRVATASEAGTLYSTGLAGNNTIMAHNAGVAALTPGYLHSLRSVIGNNPYDATLTTLTVPTAPLTAIAGTSLLLSATNSGIYDSTGKNDLTTVGDARTSTAVIKYGSSSMYFDGTGDYLTTPLLPNLQFGTGDFTVECWNYMIARTNSTPAIFSNYNNYITGALCLFAGHVSGTTTAYQVAINGASFPVIQGGTIAYNTWVHLAVVRYNGIISLYVNGTSVGTPYSTAVTLNGVGSLFYIGTTGDNLSQGSINGYLDDLRVTKGIARYTTTFTPPTAPFAGQ